MSTISKSPKIVKVTSSPEDEGSNFWGRDKMLDAEAKDALTLEEVEHRALINRILNILRLTYERLQIALVIPYLLLPEDNVFSRLVSSYDRDTLYDICSKYLDVESSTSVIDSSNQLLVDHELINAIDHLHSNREFCENLPKYIKCLPATSQSFLNAVSDLGKLAEIRMNTTAQKELEKEKMLHEISQENEKMEQKIDEMKAQIREKDISMQWKIAEKQGLIQKYKKDLANKKWNNHILIRKEVTAANELMAQIYTKSEERQQELKEEATKAKVAYEKLLLENMRADKKLREKKARILTQLKGWIKKYDNDVGERTREIDRLEAELSEKTAAYDEFMKLYEKQEADYNAIVAMREAEDKKLQEEKLLLFMMNRAARMIQRRWRAFRVKKKAKGKGKGKKGKK